MHRITQLEILRPFFARYWMFYLLGVVLLIFVDFLHLGIPRLIGQAIDGFLIPGTDPRKPLLLLLLITIAIALTRYLYRECIMGTTRRLEFYLRQRLFLHALRLPMSYYDVQGPGKLMALMTNDITAVRMAVGLGTMLFVDAIIMGFASVAVMAVSINAELTWRSVLPLPLVLLAATLLGQTIHKRFRAVQEKFSELTEYSQEIFSGSRVIKGFAAEKTFIDRFAALSEENVKTNMVLARTQAAYMPLTHIAPLFCYVIALYSGGKMMIDGIISVGEFTAFTGYLGLIIWPIMGLGYLMNIVQRGSASLNRIAALLAEPLYEQETPEQEGTGSFSLAVPRITIRHLTFFYPQMDVPALQNISLFIPSGATVGIVGRTGSGKSTLLKLLLRLYDPPYKSIFINDKEIHAIDYSQLREAVGYVSQDSLLFSRTIGENIAFDKDYSPGEIQAAAKAAVVKETIDTRTEGFETVLGEKGRRLSGGQQQRVSIARALIKQPGLLLLDDIFAALDYRTQVELLANMKKFVAGRTSLIVSQRVAAVKDADFIVVMENGTIVEQGTHQELIAKKNAYYSLYEQQIVDGTP
ncbi:MAG: transporter related protein [Firmicutes bacterium]|nr:transporter related protein [Bacillota bacterium]